MGGGKAGEIEEFLKKVRERFEPKLILLFGSRARGEELKESDYDLIVVSEKFRGVPFLERLYMLYELWDLKQRADILAYTPEEFEQKRNEIGVVRKAVEEGIVIGGRSEEKLGRGLRENLSGLSRLRRQDGRWHGSQSDFLALLPGLVFGIVALIVGGLGSSLVSWPPSSGALRRVSGR